MRRVTRRQRDTADLINYLLSEGSGVGQEMYDKLLRLADSVIGPDYAQEVRRWVRVINGRFHLEHGVTVEV